jgi:hypothetical protein
MPIELIDLLQRRYIMTKADLIRKLLRKNPTAKPKPLAEIATKRLGSLVKPSDVSNYKTLMNKNGELNGKPPAPAPEKPAAPRPAPVAVARSTMSVTKTVEAVKELVQQLGKDELKKLVDVL